MTLCLGILHVVFLLLKKSPQLNIHAKAELLTPSLPIDVTAGFANITLDDRMSEKPTADQCVAHLKLLECFHELREMIATTDGLYGIKDAYASSAANESSRASRLTKIREKRWSIYVVQAVKRFELWWANCIEPRGYLPQPLKSATKPIWWKERLTPFSKSNLPPIGT